MNISDEIKERIDIVEFISQYVDLKKRGVNYVGLCPFHKEKTPSFVVSPEKRIFHCFGCGASGDVIGFFMRYEGYSFKEALSTLAQRAGISYTESKRDERKDEKKKRLKQIHHIVVSHFKQEFLKCKFAQDYFYKRGFDETTAHDFSIGYSQEEGKLLGKLNKFKKEEILQSGIFSEYEGRIYCRFHDRLIFPIFNENGESIAFGARQIKQGDGAKYINSPETPLFSKSKVLYGLNWAKKDIMQERRVVVVEGYFDVIRLHTEGIKNSVATLGTALNTYHLKMLKRLASSVIINYDADEAGIKAMIRVLPSFFETDIQGKVAILKQGEDPDSFIKERGKESFLERLNEGREIFSFLIEYYKKNINLSSPQGKAEFIETFLPIIEKIKDGVKKSAYVSHIAEISGISASLIMPKAESKIISFNHENPKKEELLISCIISNINLLQLVDDIGQFKSLFEDERLKYLFEKIWDIYKKNLPYNVNDFVEQIENEELKSHTYGLLTYSLEGEKAFKELLKNTIIEKTKNKLNEIRKKMEQGDEDMLKEYQETFYTLKKLKSGK
jgi:DNA primase